MMSELSEDKAVWMKTGTWTCAVPLMNVAETMRALPIEPVSGAPAFVMGLSVIRGAPVPVLDLAVVLGASTSAPPRRFVTLRIRAASGGTERRVGLAVDAVLFESLARELGAECVACLFTGMGKDGAAGLLEIRKAGGVTIAQDESTSVVFGMPEEAARPGAVVRVLPLGETGPALLPLARTSRARSAS